MSKGTSSSRKKGKRSTGHKSSVSPEQSVYQTAESVTTLSHSQQQNPVAQAADTLPPAPSGAGMLLRAMRQEAGVELEVLAAALKVAPQKLQALEDDHPEQLSGLVFARGLAANVCRYLGHDAQPVLDRMPGSTSQMPLLHAEAAAGHTSSTTGSLHRKPTVIKQSGLPIWVIGIFTALAAATLALLLWPRTPQYSPAASTTVHTVTTVPASAPDEAASTATHVTDATASQPVVVASAPLLDTTSGLHLHTGVDGDVWVQVRNRNGKVLFERTLPPNSQHTIAIPHYPVRVTLGRVENVRVFDRGQPFDTSTIAKTGVARFQIR